MLATALVAVVAGVPAAQAGEAVPGGVRLRRARLALAEGRTDEAVRELEAVRQQEPEGPRRLEATLLLADAAFSRGALAEADLLLAGIQSASPDPAARSRATLARGWLALADDDPARAAVHFGAVSTSGDPVPREVATIGLAWARLARGEAPGIADLDAVRAIARRSVDPAVRFAAGWSLGRAHQAAGRARRALRELRALRRLARGTPYEDDIELEIAMAQVSSGPPAAARHTLERLGRHPGPDDPVAPVLTLEQLRAPAPALLASLARAYAARAERFVGPVGFLAGALNRPAASDVPAALEIVARVAGEES